MKTTHNRREEALTVLWRRKWTAVAVFLALTITTAIVSKSLPKVYSTSSTLIVAQPEGVQDFSGVQAAQTAGRSYAEILRSSNFADRVAARLGGGTDGDDLDVTIEPVTETLLINVTADAENPRRAKQVADAYAQTFVAQSGSLVSISKSRVSVADLAPFNDSPSRPKPTLYTLIAGLLGLGLGIGLAFLQQRLDTRLRTLEDIEEAFDLPILSRVPPQGRSARSMEAFTEAFRVLRTNLQFAAHERQVRTVAVTSWSQGEGKTTTAAQLALVTGVTGTAALAVDADLRRPSLQGVLLPNENEMLEPGLSNLIVGGATIDDVIHSTHIPTLELAPSGPPVPSLSSLLDSQRGAAALNALSESAEFVIFDTPPLAVGADAATLASRVDGVVLVVDLDKATETGVREALRRLESVRARVLGFVLNRDSTLEQMSSYYYAYGERQKDRPPPDEGPRRDEDPEPVAELAPAEPAPLAFGRRTRPRQPRPFGDRLAGEDRRRHLDGHPVRLPGEARQLGLERVERLGQPGAPAAQRVRVGGDVVHEPVAQQVEREAAHRGPEVAVHRAGGDRAQRARFDQVREQLAAALEQRAALGMGDDDPLAAFEQVEQDGVEGSGDRRVGALDRAGRDRRRGGSRRPRRAPARAAAAAPPRRRGGR